ncbi:GyrI-like domain-containing protein [Cytobacillus praedii]|uniref:GyrI-like domain-containing protein n=1 Tax=Cytobacillus praedii TaxID=1742358 RepID=UPI003AF496B0
MDSIQNMNRALAYIEANLDDEIDFQLVATLEIPAVTWVVFKTSGPQPETMLKTWERIYAEWLPSSGYELAESIEFVRDLNDPTDLSANQIWIPVKRRN